MKVLFASLLLVASAAVSPGRARPQGDAAPKTVEDYFKLLPAEYVTHTGDYGPLRTIVDVKNGYYAVAEVERLPDAPEGESLRPVFEFALFRRADGGAVFVAANTKYDHACFSYETFFLKYEKAKWRDVSAEVAPHLGPELFFRDPLAVAALKRDRTWASNLRHRLSRRGTTIAVTPELCDIAIENDDTLNERERARLTEQLRAKPKSLTLRWDRAQGRFVLAK